MKTLLSSLLLAIIGLAALPASAGRIAIDFEHAPGGDGILGTADDTAFGNDFIQPLTNQFAPLGLQFADTSLFASPFFDGDSGNHFISATNPSATFGMPVTGISIESYSFWNVTLAAYDIDGKLIASEQLSNPRGGSEALRGVLSLTSTQAIYGFSLFSDSPNHIVNVDNLVLTSADPAEVPEPSQAAVFALGLALAGGVLRKRR